MLAENGLLLRLEDWLKDEVRLSWLALVRAGGPTL
jgi:hypothetical protein